MSEITDSLPLSLSAFLLTNLEVISFSCAKLSIFLFALQIKSELWMKQRGKLI